MTTGDIWNKLLGSYGNALGGNLGNYGALSNNYIRLSGTTTTAYTGATNINFYQQQFDPTPAKAEHDAVSWLKRRVEEMCWKEAA